MSTGQSLVIVRAITSYCPGNNYHIHPVFNFDLPIHWGISILCWHEQKIVQKFVACLDGKRFQNVTSIALYKNFCFVNSMTYLCFICNNFVRKSMYVLWVQ